MKLYSIPQVCELIGATYGQVYWALATKKVEAMQAGRSRLLTEANLDELRKLFAEREAQSC